MKLGHYNMYESLLLNQELSAILATGYILSDKLLLMGDVEYFFTLDSLTKKLTIAQKLKQLIGSHEKNPNKENQDLAVQLKKVKEQFNKYDSIKNKDTAIIVAYRRMEVSVNALYQEFLNSITELQKNSGITPIMDLLDQKDFTSFFINLHIPETNPGNQSSRKRVSEAQLMDIDAPEAPFDMFLLSRGFMTMDFRDNKGCNEPHDEGASTDEAGYCKILFELPILSVCSSNELKLLRNYFKQYGATFRQAIDQWLAFCRQSTNYTDRINHFTTHVMPEANNLKQAIANNGILNFIDNRQDVSYNIIEVAIGETSMQTIWNYNKFNNIIPDESWQKITEAAIANPEFAKKRVPYMSVGHIPKDKESYKAAATKKDDTNNDTITATKKSLDIE